MPVDTGDNLAGSMPRADLAALCVEALIHNDSKNLVFEVVSGMQGGNYPVCKTYEQVGTRHITLPTAKSF